jgi:hypothetical protein
MQPEPEARKAMTITLELEPETRSKLEALAARSGKDLSSYVNELIEKTVRDTALDQGEPLQIQAGMTLREILAPVHDYSRQKGYTEEELDTLFEEAREEVYQKKHAAKHKDRPH